MRLFCQCTAVLLLLSALTARAELIQINDIRIEGLQRVSASSVFAVLPVKVGDAVDQESLSVAARSIFNTGNFQDIKILLKAMCLFLCCRSDHQLARLILTAIKR